MKVEQLERYTSQNAPYSCFIFSKDVGTQGDILFVGCESGQLLYFSIPVHTISKTSRTEEFTRMCTNVHRGPVQCMMVSFDGKLTHRSTSSPLGVLFTGGKDNTIKVWNPYNAFNPLIQTLVGHKGVITCVVDGQDGSVLSSSSDGTFRVWTAQQERTAMLNPYFECTFVYSAGKGAWLSSLAVSAYGIWTAYIGHCSGDIELFRKGAGRTDGERAVADMTMQLSKHKLWESVHSLDIFSMLLISDDDMLITASYDGSCKLLDSKLGHTLFHIVNPSFARYVGLSWVASQSRLYLVDELGGLEIFDANKERIIERCTLLTPTAQQRNNILNSHRNQMLSTIMNGREDSCFYVLLPHSTSADTSRKAGAGSGDIVSWYIADDHTCAIFAGHEGSVVGLAAFETESRDISNITRKAKTSSPVS